MNRRVRTFAILVMGVALVSCSQTPTIGVSLSVSAVDVVRGGQATIDVTVAGAGSGPVSLGIAGLPGQVVAGFSPSVLPAGATTSTLTLDVAAAAAAGASSLTVTATGDGRVGTASLTLTVTSLTVDGVVTGILGEPLAGVNVAIAGVTTATDTDGAFTITGIAVPYDVVVYRHDGERYAHVFVGMTTPNPALVPFGAVALANGYPQATVEGTLPAALGADEVARVCIEGTSAPMFGCGVVDGLALDEYAFPVTWVTGVATNVQLHAILTEVDADGIPTGYGGYGTAGGSVTGGGTSTIAIATYAPVSTTVAVSGTIAPPLGMSVVSLLGSVRLSPAYALPVFDAETTATSFDVVMPAIGDATFQFLAFTYDPVVGTSAAWAAGVDGAEPLALALPTPAGLVTPADGATGVTTATQFTMSGAPGLARTFIFDGTGAHPDIAVTTMANTVTIPNLGAFGFGLPASADYYWSVIVASTATNPDEAGRGWIGDYYDVYFSTLLGGRAVDSAGVISSSPLITFATD